MARQPQSEVIGRFNLVQQRVRSSFWSFQAVVAQSIECPFDVSSSERAAIVKMNAMTNMKDVGLGVWRLPTLGHGRLKVKVVVLSHQGIKQQFINAL